MLEIELRNIYDFIKPDELNSSKGNVKSANEMLLNRKGKGSEFLGWLDLPSRTSEDEINKIINSAERLRSMSEIILVIGIGGSYLGARAVIEALNGNFRVLSDKKFPLVLFAGINLDEDYHKELLDILNDHDYSVIVISKSGTTTEPAVAFRIIRKHLESKYGKANSRKRIVAITDKSKGVLRKLADEENYESFVIPDNVGGRFSVLTPVGLLPIASAGFDINKLIDGARESERICKLEFENNPSDLYASARYALYRKGKVIEIFATYNSRLIYFAEWWKQLFGESEGKDGKGIFPASVNFTSDLHSLGQLIQDGCRNIFETVISVESYRHTLELPEDEDDIDDLNFISGKRLGEINKMAELGTSLAHREGGVPVINIKVPEISELTIGFIIYFFEKACAVSGYLNDVNPFDQPGVEAYKKNMFALLGKPGYEDLAEIIKSKL
ncbi:MAG: glucose-6-phosphate isomerase [Ignavibacteria bacterium]|nr:glucose-6-phosphate isomerase [Ignavibacteria bacterium]